MPAAASGRACATDITARQLQAKLSELWGQPVIVDVNVDYSKPTAFTRGAVKTNFRRFPLAQKLRMALRVLGRKIAG